MVHSAKRENQILIMGKSSWKEVTRIPVGIPGEHIQNRELILQIRFNALNCSEKALAGTV